MIVGVAIKMSNGTILSLPKPNRHGDVIKLSFTKYGRYDQSSIQGFVNRAGVFFNREEAMVHAIKFGQASARLLERNDTSLYSEDLW